MYLDAISLGKWITTSQDKQMFWHEKNLSRNIYYIVTKENKNEKMTWLNGVMLELLPLQEHCPP